MTEKIAVNLIEEAYIEQRAFVLEKAKTRGIGGYKAAVSSPEGQDYLGLSQLLSGVLYADGELENNCTIDLSEYTRLKIETEIGFRLSRDVTEKTSAITVQNMVGEVLPVFEIPDITADDPSSLTPLDLIRNNTFSSHVVLGDSKPANSLDPNSIVAELLHNGVSINKAPATSAMNNQWEALSIALNLSIDHGFLPKKGDLVITGALGQILELKEGIYFADYGDLGEISVEVV